MIRCARFKSRKQVSGREGREIINLIVIRQSVILYLNITMKPRVIRFLKMSKNFREKPLQSSLFKFDEKIRSSQENDTETISVGLTGVMHPE